MLASVVGGLPINLVAPHGPYPHPQCRDAGRRCLVVAVQPEDGRGEQTGPRRDGRGDARNGAPDEGTRARLIVNAASVQAAKSVPRRPDICGASGLLWPNWSIGWWYRRT